MLPVEPGSSARYIPLAAPQPPPYQVQPKDTVQSVAQTYKVTPEELARTNGISVTTDLAHIQTLTLPANAVPPAHDDSSQPAQTPAQKTDAAISAYQDAVKHRDELIQNAPHNGAIRADIRQSESPAVDSAQKAMDTAIQNEIAGEVAYRNNGTPVEFRTPTDQLITSAGQAILQRHQGDPGTQSAISAAVSDYQLTSKAQALIPSFSGDFSPHDKLLSLSTNLQGQPQEVVDRVLADPNVQSWVKAAADQVAQPYAHVKSGNEHYAVDQASQAAGQLQMVTDGLPPALATAVTQASMPTIQKIAQLELGSQGSMVPFDSVQSVLAGLGDSGQANAVINQAAAAYAGNLGAVRYLTASGAANSANSPLTASISQSPGYGSAGSPAFAIALGNQLSGRPGLNDLANRAFDAGAQGVHDYLANNGGSPLKAYDAAHAAAQQTDQKLAELLAKAGPLTDEQKQAVIKAYRDDPDHAKAYQADADAAKKLAGYMQTNQASLIYAAGRNPDAAQQLYSAMKDLAQSGQGKLALQFAGDVQNDPAALKAFGKFSDYESKFLPDAMASAHGQLLVEDGGDTKMAGSQLLELASPVFKFRNGWNLVKENFEKKIDGNGTFNAKALAQGYKEMGLSGKAWAVAAVTTDSVNGVNVTKINEMIGEFSMAGGDVTEVGTGALKTLADAGKFGAYNATAETMAKLGAKFVPGLSVIASTAAFVTDFNAARDNQNPAYAGALLGDTIAVIGSFMETAGVTEVPGAVVTGIGILMSAPFELVGKIIDGNKEQKDFQEEQVKYLEAGGIDKDKAEVLAKDGEAINAFAKQLGLSPQQAQDVLMAHREAFDQGAGNAQGLIDVVKACQIKPEDVGGFVDALAHDNPDYVRFFSQPRGTPTTPLTNRDDLADLIGGGGFTNAKAYVQSHAPDVFSAAGSARRQADRQYEVAQSLSGSPQMQIGNLLKSNHDPVYQSEIIKVMKDNGTLDTWVKQMGTEFAYNGWDQAAKSAIQNAQNTNVLSADEAQRYLGQLG
ncbi:LysM peptidoglycan-binding domain-containing protein [Dyella subtropica]|uniref:LysM peptidoglycan-binding domain-containing protein n=1 Tax=Dyella subtropica TaxID=2992127 RepID=UPI002255911A|nr:LysM peptidoglycan-binding domain-containing protein [Dyella subtropica]